MCGAHIPGTIPGIGAKICSFLCAKLSSAVCFCTSGLAVWVIGMAAVLVIGHPELSFVG